MARPTPLLELHNVSKTFTGVKALQKMQLTVYGGEVHALMGENGAGKSTLMKILSGAYIADPGATVKIDGKTVVIDGPTAAKNLGVAVIYQELCLAPNLTVAENIYMGRPLRRRGVVDRAAMVRACEGVLTRLGADYGPTTLISELSIAQRQLVEIARAVHFEARILVMDEPTTPLSSHETDRLFALIRQLRAEGLAIIYISHRMAEIDELADRVTVLRDGCYVGTITREQLSRDVLVKMMVGRDLSSFYRKEHKDGSRGPVVLSARNMADGRRVRGCSFELHAGEVLGLAGLVGAGRTELARLVFGADERQSGEILLGGRALTIKQPLDAIRSGIVYLTEDRKGQGLFLDLSVHENINVMVCPRDAMRFGVMDRKRATKRSAEAIRAMGVRTPTPHVNVGALSGGNQQKVLLARLLELSPRVLILDEPTRGVDIGAKSEIYRLIDELARSGVAVLVISSELPEVMGICDRVLVMREGRIAGEVGGESGRPLTQEAIVALATGATETDPPTRPEPAIA